MQRCIAGRKASRIAGSPMAQSLPSLSAVAAYLLIYVSDVYAVAAAAVAAAAAGNELSRII